VVAAMDDTEDDDARSPRNGYSLEQDSVSSHQEKVTVENSSYPEQYEIDNGVDLDDDNDAEKEEGEGEDEHDSVQPNGNGETDDGDEENEHNTSKYDLKIENEDVQRHQKKRKMKSLLSNYEFAPRVSTPSAASVSAPKAGGRNSVADWTEHESIVLLDAWGERFVQRGRKSLRSDEWQEVADAVSVESKYNRTDTQCRNRLDTLKKKYKKEKLRVDGVGGATSKWVYFKKMDMLISGPLPKTLRQCGAEKGKYIPKNPRSVLHRPNVPERVWGSEINSEEENDILVMPRKTKSKSNSDNEDSFRMLADCIYKFSDIYEKTENSKRKQMLELEKMRMDFHRDLELQKRQMLERAQDEIAKIRRQNHNNDSG
jgi:hypothetical protein